MITGKTRILAIVGDPISQVRSPLFYNERIARAGVNAVLVPWHAPAAHFEVVFNGLLRTANLDGIVVTYPFKQQALRYADTVGVMGQRVGAVNALRREADGRWTGDMFDGVGLVRAVRAAGGELAGRRVKLIGAGGAGSAIAYALAEAGIAGLSIYDSELERAAAVAQNLRRDYPTLATESGNPALGEAEVLINATPIGLRADDGLPLRLPMLPAHLTVVDIVPRADGTALLRRAREAGCRTVEGAAMVEGQADAVLDFFGVVPTPSTGQAAPRDEGQRRAG